MSRLLRAVNESSYAPIRSEWTNYILELGFPRKSADDRGRKVDQIDMASGTILRTWDSIGVAARILGIPIQDISSVLLGKVGNTILFIC